MIIINYVIMCLVFGTTFLAIKIGVDAGAPPFMSGGIRFFLAGFILFMVLKARGRVSLSILYKKEMFLSGLGLTFGTFATLYWAEQYVSSGIAAVLSATGPMMIMIIQTLFLREKMSRKSLLGCFIGFIGVSLLLSSSVTLETSLIWIIGCIVILIGEISYASGAVYSKRVIGAFKETSPIALNAVQMMYGGGLLILSSFLTEQPRIESLLSSNAIGSIVYLTVAGSMVGHSLFYWLVSKTNPVFPSTWLYISPLIAVTIGAIFYQEPISPLMGTGIVTILLGTALINIESIRTLFNKRTVISK